MYTYLQSLSSPVGMHGQQPEHRRRHKVNVGGLGGPLQVLPAVGEHCIQLMAI